MSGVAPQQDGPNSQEGTNLDHLIISVPHPVNVETYKNYPLVMFISRQGRQSTPRNPRDFDYESFCRRISADLEICKQKLYVSTIKETSFDSEAGFHDFLSKAQTTKSPPHPDSRIRLQYHEITSQDLSYTKKPGAEEDQNQASNDDREYQHQLMNRGSGVMSDSDWPDVCTFFNCSVGDEKVDVDGINLKLHRYQAWTVWRVFSQNARYRIPSFIIGDASGLGKTGMSLVIATIFAMLKRVGREVKSDRSGRHCDGNSGPGTPCPTQGKRIQCPCVSGSLSASIVKEMLDFPTLICAPAGLIGQWEKEAKLWIDSPGSIMNVFICHGTTTGPQQLNRLAHGPSIEGSLEPRDEYDPQNYKILEKAGSSENIIIFSRHNRDLLSNKFIHDLPRNADHVKKKRKRKGDIPRKWNSLGSRLVFFDEYHNYFGSSVTITQPFEFLGEMRQRVGGKILAVGLSGNIKQSPALYKPFVDHCLKTNEHYTSKENIDRGDRKDSIIWTDFGMDKLQSYVADFQFLTGHMNTGGGTRQQQRDRFNQRYAGLVAFLGKFNAKMIVARERDSEFLGQRIGGPLNEIRTQPCLMPDGETLTAIRALSEQVTVYLDREYEEYKEDCADRRKAPLNRIKWANMRLSKLAESEHEVAAKKEGDRVWQTLARSCTYPRVLYLVSSGKVNSRDLLVEEINRIARPITNHLRPEKRIQPEVLEEVDKLLKVSPFYQYLEEIEQQSPKIEWVKGRINVLLEHRDRPKGDPNVIRYHGDPPADGTNHHHLILFSEEAISAFLSFMVLWKRYEQQIREQKLHLLLVHSAVPARTRDEYTQFMQKDCCHTDPIKVLISTSSLYGEGHNLQRVNTCILTEIPRTYERQRQSFSRIDRQGQMMIPRLYQLYDSRHPTENIRKLRSDARMKIAKGKEGLDLQKALDM